MACTDVLMHSNLAASASLGTTSYRPPGPSSRVIEQDHQMARQLAGRKRFLVEESTSSSEEEFSDGSGSSDEVFSVEESEDDLEGEGELMSEEEPGSAPEKANQDDTGEEVNLESELESEGDAGDDGNGWTASDDTVSLASVDSGEAEEVAGRSIAQKSSTNAPVNEVEQYSRVKGIFAHALLRGVQVPAATVAEDWGGAVALTSTRTTPRKVLDAIDRDLRFGTTPVTVEALAQRYGCKRLVVTRRIESLRAAGLHFAGVYFSSAARKPSSGAQDHAALSQRQAIDRDIQTLRPAVTVQDLAAKHGVPADSVRARVQYLSGRGASTKGVVRTGGAQDCPAAAQDGHDGALRPFSVKQDAAIVVKVSECRRSRTDVPWSELDELLGRHAGDCKQRWLAALTAWGADRAQSCDARRVAESLGLWRSYAAVCASRPHGRTSGSGSSSSGAGAMHDSGGAAESVANEVSLVLEAVVEVVLGVERAAKVYSRSFTAAEDAVIIEACGSSDGARRSQRFWDDLDRRLDRPRGSCRSRWTRCLAKRGRARGHQAQHAPSEQSPPVAAPAVSGTVPASEAAMRDAPEDINGGGMGRAVDAVQGQAVSQGAAQLARYTATMDALWRRREASGELTAAAAQDGVRIVRLVLSSVVQVLVESTFLSPAVRPASALTHAAATLVRVTPVAAGAAPVPVAASRAETSGDDGAPSTVVRQARFTAEEDAVIVRRVAEFRLGQFPRTRTGGILWSAIDKELGRSKGAAKLRWSRTLGARDAGGDGDVVDL